MKKKVKTVCQIIRFRGKIEAFLVSIDLFDIPKYPAQPFHPTLTTLQWRVSQLGIFGSDRISSVYIVSNVCVYIGMSNKSIDTKNASILPRNLII